MPKTVEGPKLEPNVTLLVGPRFQWGAGEKLDEVLRGGMGFTVVIDRIPVAGPIYAIEGLEDGNKMAQCHNCGKQSELLDRSEAIRRWAHDHRCKPEDVRNRFRRCPY